MKGRFRKGKKAFRSAIKSPRQARFEWRYQQWLIRKFQGSIMAGKVARAAIVSVMGAMAIAQIRSSIHLSPLAKASAIATQVIQTSQQFAKIFAES